MRSRQPGTNQGAIELEGAIELGKRKSYRKVPRSQQGAMQPESQQGVMDPGSQQGATKLGSQMELYSRGASREREPANRKPRIQMVS